MTASTETERATFEAVASDDGKWPQAIERDAKGNYLLMQTAQGWRWWQEAWQAARRAPAAPVPQFSRIAQKKLDYLLDAGEAITGYAIENKDGRRGAIDCHGFVYWWQDAAVPQPPEAAPVQMPEPVGCTTKRWGVAWNTSQIEAGSPLYTEQQVRQLLAAHGIKEQST